ncbi:unnamed protein product [Bursaphelenchus xylophilus]|uniref:(pine wood nematode) hypothetical protein n=1 Tax=Bursaphelenchus xylophilus TaxID=6326 RepID=A0A1I7SCW8_BURXY|nr:unnamed protein product [Bursaphelenchus xylophilus]CAG9093338.1 unnamed protein product [Bursaphelenchus xylophilus]
MDVASSSEPANKLTPSTSLPTGTGNDRQVLANSKSAELRPCSNDLSFKPDPVKPKRISLPPDSADPPPDDRKKSRATSESGELTNNNTLLERNNNEMNRGEDETVPLLQKPSVSSMNESVTRPASSSSNTSALRNSAVNTPTPPPSGGQPVKRVGINEPPIAGVASALPNRFAHHKRLKKYASETSFGLSPGVPIVPRPVGRVEPLEPAPAGSQQSSRNNSDSGGHDVRGPGRVFHVRTTGPNYQQASRTAGNGSTVANKVHRRRQDSDDASGSVGSETTVASGTITPVSRRMLRFKLRRPKSTGSMGNQGQGDTLGQGDTYHSTGNPYDPSFTSATIHSLESNQQHVYQDEERRASNFYIFDDDSTHEFDDEVQGRLNFQGFQA